MPSITLLDRCLEHDGVVWDVAWYPPPLPPPPPPLPHHQSFLCASCGSDATIRLWSTSDRIKLNPTEISSSYQPNQNQFPLKETDESFVWHCVHVATGEHTKSIRSLAWSTPSSSTDMDERMDSGEDYCQSNTLTGNNLTDDGLDLLASASFDGQLILWHVGFNPILVIPWRVLTDLESELKRVVFSKNGLTLASCNRLHHVGIWQKEIQEDCRESVSQTEDDDWNPSVFSTDVSSLRTQSDEWFFTALLEGHEQDVKCLCWLSPTLLLSGSYDHSIRLWQEQVVNTVIGQTREWICIDLIEGNFDQVNCQDAIEIIESQNHGHVTQLPQQKRVHSDTVWDLSVSTVHGRLLIASAGGDGFVRFWRLSETFKLQSLPSVFIAPQPLPYYHLPVLNLSQTSLFLACAGGGSALSVIEFQSNSPNQFLGKHVTILHAHDGDVNCVSFAPLYKPQREQLLATGGDDGIVCFWLIQTEI